ncbi:MAG: hypothetical protein KAT05_08140 [Spirochaetes bacterium]|nr:hypothetical protein [Spirochaetota bacterium]
MNESISQEQNPPEEPTSGDGIIGGIVLGGAIGLIFGPIGIIMGGILGAIIGEQVEREYRLQKGRK